MRTIEYTPKGEAIPDHDCERRARQFLRESSAGISLFKTSTENFIAVSRALIHEGYASHKDVVFLFDGKYIGVDADGRLPEWPDGFCDLWNKTLERILTPRKHA